MLDERACAADALFADQEKAVRALVERAGANRFESCQATADQVVARITANLKQRLSEWSLIGRVPHSDMIEAVIEIPDEAVSYDFVHAPDALFVGDLVRARLKEELDVAIYHLYPFTLCCHVDKPK